MNSLNKQLRFALLALAASTANPAQAGENAFSSIDKLPAHYAGADCSAVVRKLKSFNVAKSEFETSAAYRDRIHALAGRKLDGTRSFAEPLAFVQSDGTIESTYAADEAVLNMRVTWGATIQTIGGEYYGGSIVSARSLGSDKVTLSNAFGAKVRGTESTWTACTLAFANNRLLDHPRNEIAVSVPMTAAEARAAKQQLALLYVGTVAAPYLGSYTAYSKATMSNPHTTAWGGDSVVLNLSEIWLFNRATGKVYQKVPVSASGTATVAAGQARPAVRAPVKHGGSVDMDNCKPAYPASSKRHEETGRVSLSFLVSPAGQLVTSMVVRSSGFRDLDMAARDALSKCTFHAELENGIPVDTWVDVDYVFDLPG